MKCSKCKFDFCWVCLEQWKRHNSSTGGYFKCNRYEVLKKVEEQSAQLMSEAESKNKNMQELNRFVHYYTRFKNHENSYKLEEPLLKTAKDKMMKLAEAVTDSATAQAETKFVEDAVQQLLKARRVLKCSYVYGYYLDGPGYKKIVFEFMQTELEECTEILSQMVNRLYLRTPRRKIIEQAHIVQRKRLEFIMAISKGLVPPETPPAVRRGKKKRKFSGGGQEDEDLHRAIVASIQEVNPANPWIKDASGRHTNVNSLLEWPSPSDESEDSDTEQEKRALRENIG
uniref:Ariadne domain-containing protein n=1 Tax=Biomphalaria glabrata TaxID=6526 RepID=A0A2C9JPH1_BIOGL